MTLLCYTLRTHLHHYYAACSHAHTTSDTNHFHVDMYQQQCLLVLLTSLANCHPRSTINNLPPLSFPLQVHGQSGQTQIAIWCNYGYPLIPLPNLSISLGPRHCPNEPFAWQPLFYSLCTLLMYIIYAFVSQEYEEFSCSTSGYENALHISCLDVDTRHCQVASTVVTGIFNY